MATAKKSNPLSVVRLNKKNHKRLCLEATQRGIPLITLLNQILESYYSEKGKETDG